MPAALPARQSNEDGRRRVLYELCCEDNYSLHRSNPYKDTCEVIRITKRDDLLDPPTTKYIKNRTKRDDVFCFWCSSPCTGGTGWNRGINVSRGAEAASKIRGLWQLFHTLWKVFTELAGGAIKWGMPAHVEWPHSCSYWSDKRVIRFARRYGGITSRFHGCAYGMVASSGALSPCPQAY